MLALKSADMQAQPYNQST